MLPLVMFIDLRENTPLLCHDIMRFQPSKFITIISDCNYLTTRILTHAITETSTTHEKKKKQLQQIYRPQAHQEILPLIPLHTVNYGN